MKIKHNIKILCATILFSVMSLIVAYGQSGIISGVVVDNVGEPLIGAAISKEDGKGSMADNNGEFNISAKTGDVLTISFIGFVTQTVTIGNQTNIRIVMEPSATDIDEFVVIGYGKIAKKDLTGSIQSVSGNDLMKAMNVDITESLNGRIGGVLVTKSSNRPGAEMNMQIRGMNTITGSTEPLYVIDGVPSYNGIQHLNAVDIESIDVLKDASSGAIYGSRGVNGVVVITTKGAVKKEGFTLDYNGHVGIKTPTRIPDMKGNKGDGMQYYNYRTKLWTKKYGESSLARPDFLTKDERRRIRDGEFYDWIRELASNSIVINHSVYGSGGSEKTSYSMGLSYMKDEGFIGSEEYERYTANIGLEHRMNKKFTMSLSSYFSMNNQDKGSNEALINAYFLPPIVSPYDYNGDYLFYCQPTSSKINPFIQSQNHKRELDEFYVNVSGFLDYKILPELSVRTRLSYQYNSHKDGEWVGTMTQQQQGINSPTAHRSERQNLNLVWDNIVTYDKRFSKDHRLHAIGLFSMQKEEEKGSSMGAVGLPYKSYWHAIGTADEIVDVNSFYWEKMMMSVMLRANYTFKDRYLFTITGRYDGTSILASKNRWGLLPSFAVGWDMSKESFLQNAKWLNTLKLRLSWGRTGNSNLSHDAALIKLAQRRYSMGGKGVNGFGHGELRGASDLRWEIADEWNLGLDFSLFNGRLSGTVDMYTRTNKDLIIERAVGFVNGYDRIYQNVGTISNKGIEVGINSINLNTRNFTWRTDLTFSLNRNKIKDLYGDKTDDLGNRLFIGKSRDVYYDYKQLGIWQEHEAEEAKKYGQAPGHIKVWDKNDDGAIDARDMTIIGNRSPDWTMGITNTFNYRDFDLSFYVYAHVGGLYSDDFMYMMTAWDNEHWNKLDVPYWTAENKNNKWPQVGSQSYHTQVLGQTKGTFVKIQNITLGYTLPKSVVSKIRLDNIRAYVSVQNPFTFTSYRGSDPEIIGENVYQQLSLYPMIFSVGLNLRF